MNWKLLSSLALVGLSISTGAWASQPGAANRAWVSGKGIDQAGCGAPTAPCRSLQYAHDNIVVAGGEIDVLDPAGYGAITITKSISIVNDGVGTAGVQQPTAHAVAITIQAGPSDAIVLRGLNIQGLGVADSGVFLNSGGQLSIENCSISGFAFTDLGFAPTSPSSLHVSETRLGNNPANSG